MGEHVVQGAAREVRLDVAPGLYVLRYVGSIEPRTAPFAAVRPVGTSADVITLVSAPGLDPSQLSAPGSSIVVVVRARGAIDINLRAAPGSSNLDAKFSLDLLAAASESAATDRAGERAGVREDGKPGTSGAPLPLDILAHVSRRGDIKPDAEGWIGGPKSPSAIEGLEIQTRSAEVGLAAQFLNSANPKTWSAWLTPGAFVGTRQQASPLTGLRLKLVGAAANRFEIDGEALFLGSPKVSGRGNEVELTVAGGLDPLVGLRVAVSERRQTTEEAPVRREPRVRVFR